MPGPNALLIHLRGEAEAVNATLPSTDIGAPVRSSKAAPMAQHPAGALCPQPARLDCASRLTHAHTRSPRSPGDDPDMAAPSPALSPPRAGFFSCRPAPFTPTARAPSQCRLNAGQRGDDQHSPMACEPKALPVWPCSVRADRNDRATNGLSQPRKNEGSPPRFWHQPLLNERREATTLVGFHRADYSYAVFSNPWLAELHLRKRG
jgi:hypothetical protein